MVTIIKKGTAKSKILQILHKMKVSKGIDAYKYCGIISLKADPMFIQKQMRDEWE
jgi:hypothetical protein